MTITEMKGNPPVALLHEGHARGDGAALRAASPIAVQGLIVDTKLYRKEDLSADSIKALGLLFFKPCWADLLGDKFDLLRWFNGEFKGMIKKGARW